MATPYALVVLDQTTSTQDEARRCFTGERPILVVSDRQTGGRGRFGAVWEPAPRGVAMSLAFACDWPQATWPRLSLAAGLALRGVLGDDMWLKWPNDVMNESGKLAGVLVEGSGSTVIIGAGVNLWWPDAPEGYATLHDTDPGPDRMLLIAHEWAGRMLELVEAGPDGWGIDDYRAVCRTIGREITWLPAGKGRAIGVNDDGTLAVETEDGLLALAASSVQEVRPA